MTTAFMLGNLGVMEIGIIIVILVLLFGAKRIPQVARALGSSFAEFKKGKKEGERQDDKSAPHETAKEPEKEDDSSHAKD